MKEKLIIKKFGPIKSVELELSRFNVLIGEQATGKSTVAKILAVCRYFSYIMKSDSVLDNYFEQGLDLWGLSEFVKEGSFISYQCNHYTFSVTVYLTSDHDPQTGETEGTYFNFSTEIEPHSEEFKNLLQEFEMINPNKKNGYGFVDYDWKPPTSFFINDVTSVMDNPFYLPTERGLQSIFSLGKNSIQNISDSLFNQFAKLDQIARLFKEETIIESLDITYKNVNGRGYTRKKDEDKFYSLFNGASGYQSTIPVVLVMKYYTEPKLKKKRKTFIIEEPELNLFPTAQKELVKFFAEEIKFHNGVLLTTHSPYILTAMNNLMYAHNVGKEYSDEANKIIPNKYWLNPENVSAYMMLPDGSCEDIFNREENLIKADKIDEVSRILNTQFEDLLTLEYAKNESDS